MTIKLSSSDIPQANRLSKVLETVQAVYEGHTSDNEIAGFIGYTPRQARYYRKAAEILGFIKTTKNQSTLTESGFDFITALETNPNHLELLKPYILRIPLIREVLENFQDKANVTSGEFLEALLQISGLDRNETTASRRLSTFIAWLNQVGLLTKTEIDDDNNGSHYQVVPYVPLRAKPSMQIISLYDHFVSTILPYLTSNEESMTVSHELSKSIQDILVIKGTNNLEQFVNSSSEAQKAARLILSISEKDEIDFDQLEDEIQDLQLQEITPERVLLERFRSLRSAASSASRGGNGLEKAIAQWFNDHSVAFQPHHLFENLSKNCDFFASSLGLIIEAKYSKTSGTKHAGAIKDLAEISKIKSTHPEYLVGIAIAGKGFVEDKSTWESLRSLYDANKIDFILTPHSLKDLSPYQIKRTKFPDAIKDKELDLELDAKVSTWSIPESKDELGFMDATNWLNRYSKVSYLSFESLLQTWISQTPFALQCLRLILNWSESKMENYVGYTIPEALKKWKLEVSDYGSVHVLVKGLDQHLGAIEKDSIKNFFQTPLSIVDLVIARELGLSGWAKKKHETSSLFVNQCKESTKFEMIDKSTTLNLSNGLRVKSNFSYIDSLGNENHVLCKYYSTDGSVQSDLVKTVEALCETAEKDKWLLITDGTGWPKRDKDLRRLLSVATAKNFRVMTLHMWKSHQPIKDLKKRIL